MHPRDTAKYSKIPINLALRAVKVEPPTLQSRYATCPCHHSVQSFALLKSPKCKYPMDLKHVADGTCTCDFTEPRHRADASSHSRKKAARCAGVGARNWSQTSRPGQPGFISMASKARPKYANQGRHAFEHFRHTTILAGSRARASRSQLVGLLGPSPRQAAPTWLVSGFLCKLPPSSRT